MFGLKKATHHILWRSDEAAVLTGGQNTQNWRASGVAINVAEVKAGDLFFAAHGDDLQAVFDKGAAAAVVPHTMRLQENWPCLRVTNTFEALRVFANAGRFKTHALVVAIQGETERENISAALSEKVKIHEGGRHMSQGLAALPDDVSYGVFGFSPAVAPDVTIITDVEKAIYSRVFHAMPAHGIVLMDMSVNAAPDCLAAIKSAGLRHVYDVQEILHNPKIIKQKSAKMVLELAATMISKGLTPLRPENYAALKVRNLIDVGARNRTIILESTHQKATQVQNMEDWNIPHHVGNLNLVCTSKQISIASSIHKAVRKAKEMDFRKIIPDVLIPGDYVIFKKPACEDKIEFNTALRIISPRR